MNLFNPLSLKRSSVPGHICYNFYFSPGRIQDLSEEGARFMSEQKNPDFGTKKSVADVNFFLR